MSSWSTRALVAVVVSLFVLLLVLVPQRAEADIMVGANVELAVPIGDDLEGIGLGFGLDAFAAYVLPLPILDLALGVDGGYTYFSEDDAGAALDVAQILGMVRLGADLIVVVPEVFAGIGYGWLSGEGSDFVIDHSGLSWQVGAGLGFGGLPLVTLGVHAVYNELIYDDGTNPTYQWVDAGVHAKIVF